MKKKTIAKHTLGLMGTFIVWNVLNQMFYSHRTWIRSISDDGGALLLSMIVGYIVVYWAVKTIWFDKDKDSQKGD
jgi:hypothetical protein